MPRAPACSTLHLQMQRRYYGFMATTTIGFAIADEDRDRLDRLVQHFGAGNRSAFLRAALPVMEALARADRLRELQARNAERVAAAGLDGAALLHAIKASYKGGQDTR
jgi:Arc/MetJ-type ribon-helix-helix transcriptional regulator